MKNDERLGELMEWVARFDGFDDAQIDPASTDASFRRYFRVEGKGTFIVMDAPPPQEDCAPFVQVAGFLEQMGLNSARVLKADLKRGFLLLSDLGSLQYLDAIKSRPESAALLYADAIEALLAMQSRGKPFQSALPPYDEKLLRLELSLFYEWLCRSHLGLRFSDADNEGWQRCCDVLVSSALSQRRVFVHRDYHSRNLMVTESGNPGILDFQDAVEGPLTYDLVSLLKDCYVKWPEEFIEDRALDFYERLPRQQRNELNSREFMRAFDLMGVQRHLKAAGIFARLLHRDGKAGYLKDVPRTLSYIVDIAPQYVELAFLAGLINDRVMPALTRLH